MELVVGVALVEGTGVLFWVASTPAPSRIITMVHRPMLVERPQRPQGGGVITKIGGTVETRGVPPAKG
jgi:hypothetical protein